MKKIALFLVLVMCAGIAAAGPLPLIPFVELDGWLMWTNQVTNATYRIAGLVNAEDWMVTWQKAQGFQISTSSATRLPIPMQFGLLRITNLPPRGMALVEAGEFIQGSYYTADEMPVHTTLIHSFYIDKTEVPYTLWNRICLWGLTNGYTDLSMGASGWRYNLGEPSFQSNHPVVSINWHEAAKWCNARSEAEGLTPAIYSDEGYSTVYRTGENNSVQFDDSASGYRLPTEAEWEKASRGGLVQHSFPWPSLGENDPTNYIREVYANYADSFDVYEMGTTPAGWYNGTQFIYMWLSRVPASDMANGFGLYDMAGNVSEWCWDWYDGAYYDSMVYSNPRGPDADAGFGRVYRGGNYFVNGLWMRCAARAYAAPSAAQGDRGFRCVRDADLSH